MVAAGDSAALWSPAVVTGVIALLGWAVNYGMHGRAIRDHDGQLRKLDEDQRDQWEQINDTRADVGKIRGKLGLNGDQVHGD